MAGYIVREQYLRMGAEKPGASVLVDLDGLVELVDEVAELERTFPTRLAAARGQAQPPRPSRAAQEQIETSDDADTEVHRLLLRRCRRAESARQVWSELLTLAQDDVELDEDLASEFDEGDPGLRLHMEVVEKKRVVVARLREACAIQP
ncbi:MAG: hypothetical protein AAF389_18525 [Gemmatimonadota bacterium]